MQSGSQVVGLFCKLRIVHRQQLRDFEGRWKICTETETEQITGMQKTLFAQVDLFCGSGELIACTCHLINNNKYLNLATTNNSDNLATTNNNKNYLNNSNWSGGVSSPGSSLAGAFSSPQSNCHNRRLQVSAPAPPSSLLLASWL